jgi:hypothetical protein
VIIRTPTYSLYHQYPDKVVDIENPAASGKADPAQNKGNLDWPLSMESYATDRMCFKGELAWTPEQSKTSKFELFAYASEEDANHEGTPSVTSDDLEILDSASELAHYTTTHPEYVKDAEGHVLTVREVKEKSEKTLHTTWVRMCFTKPSQLGKETRILSVVHDAKDPKQYPVVWVYRIKP